MTTLSKARRTSYRVGAILGDVQAATKGSGRAGQGRWGL